ncbi:MAG TPA: PIN domain-containing protein [Candidatus Saccharimonadales bacterium]|nr:PIN domain-containing protein [Candidatus Saccharimonadales bacterium]
MKRYRVILDTNVVLAALRSQTGASHRLLLTIGHSRWQSVITPALMYEYEDVARRPGNGLAMSSQDITNILDLIYQQSHRQLVWFSWRPVSPDPGDDAILEAAIAGGCDFVVSFNERHLRVARQFGIEILRPADLLKLIGESK